MRRRPSRNWTVPVSVDEESESSLLGGGALVLDAEEIEARQDADPHRDRDTAQEAHLHAEARMEVDMTARRAEETIES